MTPAHEEAVRDCADAELRGDAAEALRLHRSVPFFVHSTHGDQLDVLAQLGESAPSWMISRWLTIQARRRMWTGGDERQANRVLQFVVPLLYPDGIPWEPMGCAWPEQVLPLINGQDWVVRQVDLYELGALRDLVRRHASEELLARADDLDEWIRAPMRALRLETSGPKWPEPVVVTDLRNKELIEVLDLGVGEQLPAGQHLLARLVPTRTEPGVMFDWRPLPVDEQTARAVSRLPSRWLQTLHLQLLNERLELAFSHQSETVLSADLPQHAWMGLLGTPLDAAPDKNPAPVVAEALRVALSLAADGASAVGRRRHLISQLMLEVSSTDDVLSRLTDPQHLAAWQTLAEALPPPARERAESMVLWCDPALPRDIA
jgi:hypothetical protein